MVANIPNPSGIIERTTERRAGIYLANTAHTGDRDVVVGKPLDILYAEQAKEMAATVCLDRFVFDPQLPVKTFESVDLDQGVMPLSDAENRRIRSENILSLFA